MISCSQLRLYNILFNIFSIFKMDVENQSIYDIMNLTKHMKENNLHFLKAETQDQTCLHMTSAPTPQAE